MMLPVLASIGEVNDVFPAHEAVWRLVAAALLGAVVGLEREVNDQPAGLRTHLTVALGAALFGVISTLGFAEFVTGQRDVNIQFDVTRVASQVVVGVGFLGAGIIFRAGSKVRNLTTAASLWVVAAIGLSAGVGDIGIAMVATAALLVALMLLRIPREAIRTRLTKVNRLVSIRLTDTADPDAVLDAIRALPGISVTREGWGKVEGGVVLELTLEGEPRVSPEHALRPIVTRPDVHELTTDASFRPEVMDD